MSRLRQTDEGTVMIGDSHEDAGLDVGTTPHMSRFLADRARRMLPALAQARIVRTWSALQGDDARWLPGLRPIGEHARCVRDVLPQRGHSGRCAC